MLVHKQRDPAIDLAASRGTLTLLEIAPGLIHGLPADARVPKDILIAGEFARTTPMSMNDALKIDAQGRVGIGTPTPDPHALLDVN
jgi:hypothetical protein